MKHRPSDASVTLAMAEGPPDLAALRKLLHVCQLRAKKSLDMRGRDNLLKRLEAIAKKGRAVGHQGEFWVVGLCDLERDYPCPGALLTRFEPLPQTICLRIAVRSLEAWLLADHVGFASHSGVPQRKLPPHPEELDGVKLKLIDLAKTGRFAGRDLRHHNRQGSDYVRTVTEYIQKQWNPARAAERSPSLQRSLSRLRALDGQIRRPPGR